MSRDIREQQAPDVTAPPSVAELATDEGTTCTTHTSTRTTGTTHAITCNTDTPTHTTNTLTNTSANTTHIGASVRTDRDDGTGLRNIGRCESVRPGCCERGANFRHFLGGEGGSGRT